MPDPIPMDLGGAAGVTLARKAIEAMALHGVPPTPHNYQVWLGYAAGLAPDLRQQIDQMLAEKRPFTSAVNDTLFDQFFGTDKFSNQMLDAGDRIAKEMSDIVAILAEAGAQSSAFGGALQSVSGKLDQGLDPAALRDMVAGLARATKEMATSNQQLTSRLEEAGREVAQMREAVTLARAEALSDGLTGLANRKNFDQTLRMRMEEAIGTKTELSLMMCDIDFFKRFNDTWGHHTGDQVIRFVASTIQRSALGDMLAARYGGEEFALIMPRNDLAAAKAAVEAIRVAVESKCLVRKSTGEDLGKITISAGIACLRPTDTPTSLLERADECLYASKRNGRNRVTTEADQARLAVA